MMMYLDRSSTGGELTDQERRAREQPDNRVLGHVVHCDGARATVLANLVGDSAENWAVGRMISINLGQARTVGLVYAVETPQTDWHDDGPNQIRIQIELVGEVQDRREGAVFDRGITIYPHIGAVAHRIRTQDLEAVYHLGGRRAVTVGDLSQDETIAARIAIDNTLDRHFAVLGTTGVGKSSAVALLLHKAIEARPDLRVLIMDPHNEFATSFPEQSVRIDATTLDLPFWMFRLEELVEVIFRGREAVAEEVDLLRDLITEAKQAYRNPGGASVIRRSLDGAITVDTPVPYRMADLLKLIDDRAGLLDSKAIRPALRALRARIESALNDPLYRFMFASNLVEDTIHETVGKIFRIPHEGRPVTCFELAGLPSEVVNSVCSVLARLAFDIALGSHGKFKLLVLCEEAHRYMPADPNLGFAPTRHALSRIAKEGRKYGCYLGVVTQRPGELDPTVLSQCSTIFAMRLANERDQDIIRSAIADSSASTLSFLSSMGQREAIAFGEGVATTMRMKFERLPANKLPGTRKDDDGGEGAGGELDLRAIVDRLRGSTRTAQAEDPFGSRGFSGAAQAGDAGYRTERRMTAGRDEHAFRRLYE